MLGIFLTGMVSYGVAGLHLAGRASAIAAWNGAYLMAVISIYLRSQRKR
jgi:hypothetical protein